MVRTRVGYAGGTKADPTYHSLGDHTETVEVDYDPAAIGYEELLEVFWAEHDPTSRPWSRQYASIILYRTEEQRALAQASLEREQARRGRTIHTELRPLERFHLAEDYHQKYYLRSVGELADEFHSMYPDPDGLVNSTAAARVNGFVGGHGTPEQAERVLLDLGLSEDAQEILRGIVRGLRRR